MVKRYPTRTHAIVYHWQSAAEIEVVLSRVCHATTGTLLCPSRFVVEHWIHSPECPHLSHISNLASATGHGVKNKGNPPSCNNKGKRYDLPFWFCRQKYSTLDLSFSAATATLMTTRTTAPTYFCTGNPFPIELQAIEDSIYWFPMVLWKFPIIFSPYPQGSRTDLRLVMWLMYAFETLGEYYSGENSPFKWITINVPLYKSDT